MSLGKSITEINIQIKQACAELGIDVLFFSLFFIFKYRSNFLHF